MNDFQLAVTGHACTGRNQLADDDVFLQTEEWIFLALDSGFGKNAGRFLEGCGGEEGVGSKSCLCRAEEQVDALGRFFPSSSRRPFMPRYATMSTTSPGSQPESPGSMILILRSIW